MKPEIIESVAGTKVWYFNGKLHREDGPAVEYPNGTKVWYFNGVLHREDGPAIEFPDGNKYWYINGEKFIEKTVLQLNMQMELNSGSLMENN
jgi:hypothetical protein